MTYVFLFVFCVIFIELFLLLGLRRQAGAILSCSRESVRVLTAAEVSDDDKEVYVRKASLGMLRSTAALALKFLLIVAVLYAAYRVVVSAFPALEAGLLRSFVSPAVAVALTIAAACYVWVRNAVLRQL